MTLAVVAHDAGGAEVLSSYVRRERLSCCYVLDGPARAIFERKLGAITSSPLEDAIGQCASVLCGASWQSDLELNAICLARALGKRSTVFLEHWTNYRERLTRRGETVLPDEIWTGDPFAHRLASTLFADVPVRLVDNPYFEDVRRDLASIPHAPRRNGNTISVLYICEPVREQALRQFGDERYWGYVEEDALTHFLRHVGALGHPVRQIVIRPHPSETAAKYEWAKEFDSPIVMSSAPALLHDIADADVVVGCQSTAMVVGLLAGKRVVSCIPPGGAACTLPFPEIERLTVRHEARSSR
jgi:hypothetical protein